MEKLTNIKTGATVGTINGNRVTTEYGDTYEVSAGDIAWLKRQANAGKIDPRDIKAVGHLVYGSKDGMAARCQQQADAWNGRGHDADTSQKKQEMYEQKKKELQQQLKDKKIDSKAYQRMIDALMKTYLR